MRNRRITHRIGLWCAVALGLAVPPLTAAITDIRGRVQATVIESRFGAIGESSESSDAFPETTTFLPLQVVSRLEARDPEEAAAAVAAQFADPRDLDQTNPEEFALNLAMTCVTPNTRYVGRAVTEEARTVIFSVGELGDQAAGESVELIGQFFLDGALTIFSRDESPDLSGCSISLRVTIAKEIDGQPGEILFFGGVNLSGDAAGQVRAGAEGAMPTDTLILTDLASVVEELGRFEVLIIPPLTINYRYNATVGQSFRLRATVEIDASNEGAEVGISGLVGTPVDTLRDVVSLTEGSLVAGKLVDALTRERREPTGALAFPESDPAPTGPFGLCGLLFGFELPLIAAGLLAARAAPRRQALPRRQAEPRP